MHILYDFHGIDKILYDMVWNLLLILLIIQLICNYILLLLLLLLLYYYYPKIKIIQKVGSVLVGQLKYLVVLVVVYWW